MAAEAPWRIVVLTPILGVVELVERIARPLGHEVVAVIAAHARPDGPPSARLEAVAAQLVLQAPSGVDVLVPAGPARIAPLLETLAPDVVFCMLFPWRVPQTALDVPRLGALNSHPSLLPRHRGPKPIAWALREGDPELGVTVHRMDADFDTGPILAQVATTIEDDDDLASLGRKLDELSERAAAEAFAALARGEPGVPQDAARATYAGNFEREYALVDWTRSAREIHNQVRAWRFAGSVPFDAGAIAGVAGERVRLLETKLEGTPAGGAAPGVVLERRDATIVVACGDGALRILESEPVERRG